jgi:hypothetical protein
VSWCTSMDCKANPAENKIKKPDRVNRTPDALLFEIILGNDDSC